MREIHKAKATVANISRSYVCYSYSYFILRNNKYKNTNTIIHYHINAMIKVGVLSTYSLFDKITYEHPFTSEAFVSQKR